MNYFNKIKSIGINIINKSNDLINKANININIKGFSKDPKKYIFYIVTIILPLMSLLLLRQLKGYTILLISFCTFLIYINLCTFQNLCIIKNKNKKCKFDIVDLKESLSFGLGALLLLFLSKRIFNLFAGSN